MNRTDLRSALTLAGALSLAGAALSGELAWLHMRWLAATYGVICGSQGVPHCAACPAAVAMLAAGLASLAGAAQLRRAPAGTGAGARRGS